MIYIIEFIVLVRRISKSILIYPYLTVTNAITETFNKIKFCSIINFHRVSSEAIACYFTVIPCFFSII